jgi:outer membrane immunogenic protein
MIMQKFLLASVAFAAMIGSAVAADLPAGKPAYKSAPPVVFNWSGCYVGGQIGGQWGNWTAGVHHDVGINPNIARPTRDLSGNAAFIGGGQVGCNYEFPGSSSVIGIEGDVVGSSKSTFSGEVFRFAPPAQIDHIDAAGKIGTQGSVRLRAGVTWDRALLYVAGGATWAELTANHILVGAAGGTAAVENSKTKTGWNVGLGVEYAFASNWTAGIEYRYTNYGSAFSYTVPAGPFFVTHTASVDQVYTSDFRFRLNYLFGGPVVARY